MSTKPIVSRNGKAMTNFVDLDGAPIGDNWHVRGLDGGARAMVSPQVAEAAPGSPIDAPPAVNVWINEFHYDNTGTDAGEFVEIAGTAGRPGRQSCRNERDIHRNLGQPAQRRRDDQRRPGRRHDHQ